MSKIVGVKHSVKARRSAKNKASGKYIRQRIRTEANRKRKQIKHFKKHPNSIKGFEKLRESLGI